MDNNRIIITINEAIINLGVVVYILISKKIVIKLICILTSKINNKFRLVYIGRPFVGDNGKKITRAFKVNII